MSRHALALGLLLSAATAALHPAAAQGPKRRPPAEQPNDPAAEPAEHKVTFVNNTQTRIHSVFVNSSRSDKWGDDLLGEDELDAGATSTVTVNGPCRSDMKVSYEGGAEESRRFVDICKYPKITVEPGWVLKPLTATPPP